MQKIKEDNEENSTQVSEEIDDAGAPQKEEDSQKDEVAASSYTANQTFTCKCAMHWRSKAHVVREGKPITLFSLIQAYEMTQNMFLQCQKQSNYSSDKVVEENCIESKK